MLLFLFVVFVCVLFLVSPFLLLRFISSTNEKEKEDKGNYLLVIAHPDDECLFFAPIILSLRANTYILCLSNGGSHRSDEFSRSCHRLRVKDHQIIDDQVHLKDSQSVTWSSEAILGHVKKAIHQWNISTIISFDQDGVSGHRNHSSIYYALLKFSPTNQIHFLALQSVPIYRKYLTSLEFLRVYLMSKASRGVKTFVLPERDSLTPHRAMFEHRSQLVWFRYLYLLFSRYIWINDFRLIY